MGIELFRGIAALMVVLTHYAFFLNGAPAGLGYLWTGVDLFFVISGFVFSSMLLPNTQAPEAAGRNALLPFWLRRFFRIYPLYLLALVAYFLISPPGEQTDHYFFRHLAFLHTTESLEEAYYFNPAFWTLPAEMEFYLILPLLALLRGRVRWLLAVSLVTLAIGCFARYMSGPEDFWKVLSVHIPSLLPEFMLGVLLAAVVTHGRELNWRWSSRQALAAFAVGVVLVVVTYMIKYGGLGLENNKLLDAPWNFLCALGYALIMFPVLLVKEELWPSWLKRVAIFAGVGSYGVYLFHNLVPRLLERGGVTFRGVPFVLLALTLTIVLAFLLYYTYENPLRRFGRNLARKVVQRDANRVAAGSVEPS
jgi:peptidoglycan/LPS O-acetylase OafA/YrhL